MNQSTSKQVKTEPAEPELQGESSSSQNVTRSSVAQPSHEPSATTPVQPSQPSVSTEDDIPPDENPLLIDPYVPFTCSICQQMEKCIYSELKTIDGYYPFPVYFMRDPFTPRPRIKGRKPLLSDFLVLGGPCSLCSSPVCLDKSCSVYFGNLFCAMCIARERKRFPEKVIQTVLKAQSNRVKGEEPEETN
ncbi:unnamed protein product, partial [Mesorhabditis belari]|uniref:Cysteine-rich DPF motif domain-containing protein 1 n=1 Tax=Mesorhabditis belari TaxID=2138241 RepID=A0AAF3FG13_9BILA